MTPARPSPLEARPRRYSVGVFAALIVAVVCLAYRNSLPVPLLLDDARTIAQNGTIRHLARLGDVLSPPKDSGVSGRPMLNLSFALNYALGGENLRGLHAGNILAHALAALTLFGVVRRTLQAPRLGGRFTPAAASRVAAATALLWAVHPLLTESVTYLSQRAESLMALFYLLTFYCFLRAVSAPSASLRWYWLSLVCCWFGVATKEVMVTAPVVVLLYDRIFFSGSFAAAWKSRRLYYIGLAASWGFLAWLMLSLGRHTIGFEHGLSAGAYALIECQAIVRYVALALWPSALVFDYGPVIARDPATLAVSIVLLAGLLVGAAALLRRSLALGFLALWFFVLLAPTSSVVPVVLQPIAESRMYLPLAAIVAGVVLAADSLFGPRLRWIVLGLGVGLAVRTVARNADYRDALSIWSDTVAKKPANARAHDHLGNAFAEGGRPDEAIQQYRQALQFAPAEGLIHYNLAKALHDQGQADAAVLEYETALRLDPAAGNVQVNLATALAEIGRTEEAAALLGRAAELDPEDAGIHYNLGLVLSRRGQPDAAVRELQRALALNPAALETRDALGTALFRLGRVNEAAQCYEEVLRADPAAAATHRNLGNVLLALERFPEARDHFARAIQLQPASGGAYTGLGLAELQSGDASSAAGHFETALRLDPADAEAHFRLGNLSAMAGRMPVAIQHWQESLRLQPANAEAHNNLGLALAEAGRISEAIAHYEEALRLNPGYTRARNNLAELQARQTTPGRER